VRRLRLSRRSSLHREAKSIEYVVFDWPNMVYYVKENRGQSRYSPLNSGMLIGGSAKFRIIGASFSRSRFTSYSSYNVWNWISSSSARAAAPGVQCSSS